MRDFLWKNDASNHAQNQNPNVQKRKKKFHEIRKSNILVPLDTLVFSKSTTESLLTRLKGLYINSVSKAYGYW